MSEKKSIITDFDDTVVNPATGLIRGVIHQTLIDSNVNLPPDEETRRIISKWGSPTSVIYRELFRDQEDFLDECRAIDPDKLERARQIHLQYMRPMYAQHVELIPGSLEVLKRLKLEEGYLIGITTATPRQVIAEDVLPKLGVPADLIDPIISAEELKYPVWSKPDPYTVRAILKAHGSQPENSVMVGDSKADVMAGKAAGIGKIVVVRTGQLEEQMQNGEVTLEEISDGWGAVVIDDFSQLESAL